MPDPSAAQGKLVVRSVAVTGIAAAVEIVAVFCTSKDLLVNFYFIRGREGAASPLSFIQSVIKAYFLDTDKVSH